MVKTPSLGVRVDPELRVFLERKAKEDKRSLSSMIHKILEEWAEVEAKKERKGKKG